MKKINSHPRGRPLRSTNDSWEAFVKWCLSRGLNPVPANPWTVAAYARSIESKYKPVAIRKRINELARIHREKTRKRLANHPMVQRTLEIIERRGDAVKRDPGLFADDDFLTDGRAKTSRIHKAEIRKKKNEVSKKSTWQKMSGQPRLVSRRNLKR